MFLFFILLVDSLYLDEFYKRIEYNIICVTNVIEENKTFNLNNHIYDERTVVSFEFSPQLYNKTAAIEKEKISHLAEFVEKKKRSGRKREHSVSGEKIQ